MSDEDFLDCIEGFDLLFFSETWVKKDEQYQLSNYHCVNVPRKERVSVKCKRGHGGVCLYIHENVYEGVQILETNDSGFIWVKLCKDFFCLTEDLCICFTYIPPQYSV